MILTMEVMFSNCAKAEIFFINRIYALIATFFIFWVLACNTSRIVSVEDVFARSDYKKGGIYTLQKPAFLFKHDIT